MPGALETWYSPAELDALAARGAVLRETLDLGRLERLRDLLGSAAGSVAAELELAPRRTGWTPAELRFETRLALTCQRCLELFEVELDERLELGLVESASLEACVPEGRIAVALENGRLSPVQLLEDELIVSLPLVPRHESAAACGGLARDAAVSGVLDSDVASGSQPPTRN